MEIKSNRTQNYILCTLSLCYVQKVKERRKSDEGSSSKRRSFQVRLLITTWLIMRLIQCQDENSGKKSKKSPYVSPGKGKPCPECNKEFRNQAVLDRFENTT